MAGREQTSYEQKIFITRRALSGINSSQIHREMEHNGLLDPPHQNITVRTVQDRVKKLSVRDTSGPWSLTEADPDQARLVLDLVAKVFEITAGRVWPTKDLAAHMARIRGAVPDIPPLWAYYVALAYQKCAAQSRESHYLDFALGTRPWESFERAEWLAGLFGWSEPLAPVWLPMMLSVNPASLAAVAERFPQTSPGDPVPEPPALREPTPDELWAFKAMGGVVEDARTRPATPRLRSSPLEPLDFDNLGASIGVPTREADAE